MVARFNRQSSMRPIHRIKHVVDIQQAGVLAVPNIVNVALAVDAPVLANTTEVETGSTVNAIYLRVEAYAQTAAALSNFYLAVFKNPGGNLALPNINVIGTSDNKKYVIHQEMVMLQQVVNGNPRTVFNGVIRIPKGYRRFGPNDELEVQTFSPGVNTFQCIQCIYKEFR